MRIHWDESMATGVAELDGQHQALIQQLNRLDEAVDGAGQIVRAEDVLDLLEYLETFASQHFADEERQMEVFQCEVAAENRREHQDFIAIVRRLQHAVQGPSLKVDHVRLRELRDELFAWCVSHWRDIDSKLRDSVMHCRTCPIT